MCLYRLGLRRSCTYNPFSMCGTSPGVLRIATQTTDYRESSVFYRSPIYVVHSMHILQRVGMDATFGGRRGGCVLHVVCKFRSKAGKYVTCAGRRLCVRTVCMAIVSMEGVLAWSAVRKGGCFMWSTVSVAECTRARALIIYCSVWCRKKL